MKCITWAPPPSMHSKFAFHSYLSVHWLQEICFFCGNISFLLIRTECSYCLLFLFLVWALCISNVKWDMLCSVVILTLKNTIVDSLDWIESEKDRENEVSGCMLFPTKSLLSLLFCIRNVLSVCLSILCSGGILQSFCWILKLLVGANYLLFSGFKVYLRFHIPNCLPV